jgi:hypothetical protein
VPADYDLIFSRDALQHLPYEKVINALERFSMAENTKYLLVGSYPKSTKKNENTHIGGYFDINLLISPFNLDKYVEIFDEQREHGKHLILYDIKQHLRTANFTQIRINAGLIKS